MPRKKKPGSTVSPTLGKGPGIPAQPPAPFNPSPPMPVDPGGPDQTFGKPWFNPYGPGNRSPNLLDPSRPGYPTTLNLPPGQGDAFRGGGYVPGPGHPAYPAPDLHGPGGIPGFANGGDFITNGPQTIMVGEGGPERVQVQPLGGASPPPSGQGGGYTGPPVMGPGQGMLPLPDPGSSADDFFGPFGTGQRGTGPSPPVGTGPFEQTFDDLGNLWDYGTTTPHWSEEQMLKAYGMSPFRALFNRDEAERSITSAEIDRIFRNVGGGLGHYTGMIPSLFGGGDSGGQWSVPPSPRGYGGPMLGQYPPDTRVPGGTHTIGPGHPAYPYPPGDAGPPPEGISQDAFDEFNRGNPFPQADEADVPLIPPGRPAAPPVNPWPGRAGNPKWNLLRKLGFGPKLPKKPPAGFSDLF